MIRGKKRPVQTPAPIVLDTGIHNRFDVEIVDAKTGELKRKARAFNVVCDGLWTALNKSFSVTGYGGWFKSIAYGNGTGTPSGGDAALFNQIGKMVGEHVSFGIDYKNSHVWIRKDISITETVAVGETITEVGIVDADNILCTHAMLQDMNGNQISIEKSDTDIVNVYATIFVHVDPKLLDVDAPVQVSLYSAKSDLSILRLIMGWHSGKGSVRFIPVKGRVFTNGTNDNEKVNTVIPITTAYDAEKRTISFSGRSAAVNNNIAGGFGWLVMHGVTDYNYTGYTSNSVILKTISPVFNGSNIIGEAVGTGDGETTEFATKYDLPKNAKIYVDGVLQTDVTVDCVPLSYQNMGQYFQAIAVEDGVAYPKVPLHGYAKECLTSDKIGDVNKSDNIFYNPYFEYGIKSFKYGAWGGVFISDDLENWVTVSGSLTGTGLASGTYTMPDEYKHYRYFRIIDNYGTINYDDYMCNFVTEGLTGKNIHFATPPAAGAVITADYETEVVTKDSNHVFDLNVVIRLGEYTES